MFKLMLEDIMKYTATEDYLWVLRRAEERKARKIKGIKMCFSSIVSFLLIWLIFYLLLA